MSIHTIYSLFAIAAGGAIAFLTYSIIKKSEETDQLKTSLNKLMRSFNDLDEQAKLIVKTDLALNRAQEELDKRLSGLNALQKASRLISTTLNEDEIFHPLNESLLKELGFSKGLILMFDKNHELYSRVVIGFAGEKVTQIISALKKGSPLEPLLKEKTIISSLNLSKPKREHLVELFGVENFVISPILSQAGVTGILFSGNKSGVSSITEGDQELISILANQIGQSLENANLFERIYRSRQELELNIQERTKELAYALEQVKRVSKMKSEFVSAVSHELRTPLTSIKGYASLLIAGKIGQIPPEVKERLEKINKHSDNLVKLINDLLDVLRIESGRVEMHFDECNVLGLIEGIRDLLTPQAKEKNIQIKINVAPETPKIFVDVSQLERVFINLMGNALKFTPQNGTITVTAKPDKESVLFEVTDTGIGIGPEEQTRLFTEFYRVDNEINKNVKGTGLGLSLAKNIVQAHLGKISVKSRPQEGTTFYFTIPIKRPEDKI